MRAPLTPQQQEALRRQCSLHVSGHALGAPGEELVRVGEWCRAHGAYADRYGDGEFIASFESKVAALLGKPAAVFMPSGTMAQLIALRIWCQRAGKNHVAMHPTSHLELHEERAYAHLHRLTVSLLGPRERLPAAADLASCTEAIATLVVELPAREIGGQLPAWDELEELVGIARMRAIRLHLDGARLWEARESYGHKSLADICAKFDSVYVSFYKGVGALAGAMLLGPEDFIAEARVWRRRQGGTLVQLHPLVASAAMRLDAQLEKMPVYRARAISFAAGLGGIDGLAIVPTPPQVNLFHVHFAFPQAAVTAARDAIAAEERAWLAPSIAAGPLPRWSRTELYVGDNLLALDAAAVLPLFAKLVDLARTASA